MALAASATRGINRSGRPCRQVQSVESENRGFDLISKKKQDTQDAQDITPAVRFIEVMGRAGIGEVTLSSNEHKTVERLKNDYCCT
jgi:hypothetical protein